MFQVNFKTRLRYLVLLEMISFTSHTELGNTLYITSVQRSCPLVTRTWISPVRLSLVLIAPLCNLGPSIINSVPCGRIVQRAYSGIVSLAAVFGDVTQGSPQRNGCSQPNNIPLYIVFVVCLRSVEQTNHITAKYG